ncbi:MAG: hypothetical protein Q7S55_02385 [Nanoarchaeota archaeon]|nr:hypothetical protein [Nanoarchaeota archaeon]
MTLEKLVFDVEGVKVILKPELHKYHNHAEDDPFLGLVPVVVKYTLFDSVITEEEGNLRYDTGKKIFITALSDFVPTDSNDTELLEKYAKGMAEVAQIYSTLLCTRPSLTKEPIITTKHYFKNSQGEWKDIGNYWLDVYQEDELRAMADAAK